MNTTRARQGGKFAISIVLESSIREFGMSAEKSSDRSNEFLFETDRFALTVHVDGR